GKVLTKTTSGTVVLTANNTYSGGVLISGGTLQIGDGDSTGTPGGSGVVITNNSQLTFDRGAGSTLTISGPISGNGAVTKLGAGTVALTGANTYSGSTTISNGAINISSASTLGDGTGALNLSGGTLNSTANRNPSTAPVSNPIHLTGDSEITTSSTAATVDLNFTTSVVSSSAGTLTFRNDGANDSTDLFDPKFSGSFVFSAPVIIENGPMGLTRLSSFNTNGTTQIFNGPISGNGSFRRSVSSGSGGTTVFNGTNTYTGTTLVSEGALLVNGSLGTNSVTVGSGGTLGGHGVVNGAVTIQSGGTLAPGASAGMLTISNSLALSAGSKTSIDLDALTQASDRVAGLTSVTYGGTLQLNLTGNLSGGESFQLFSAGSYAGSFSSITPAIPGSGLVWNTNNLSLNGTLSVISTNVVQPPAITNLVRLADRSVQFSFNGSAGQTYRVWAITNLSFTPNAWMLLTNGTFGSGPVLFTDGQATNFAQRFYRVTVP
ncbi:MAG: autotransporter-associated beta strand repeat-containing protein, partial [Akkermansiaceae bacterium]|nr:autotransporter-associated beta strand repeat-containing protein [Verrucomicrobiales bacterium]